MSEPVLFSWSSGKDSALALYEIMQQGQYEVAALLTTITADYDRISMHGVRRVLLEQQAAALGLSLEIISISTVCTNEEYASKMQRVLLDYTAKGVKSVVFGDLFLEDVRNYRETNLQSVGMNGIFPLWNRDTTELAHRIIDLGFRAVTTCVDNQALNHHYVGREFDETFLAELPFGVDPCGENGEFHSFVYAGPTFSQPVIFTKGEITLRDNRFWYCDLLPSD